MITIHTQPKSPPRVWRLNTGNARQFAVIESDHLLLSTPDKTSDRIHYLPLRDISRIYIAREKPAYSRIVLTALGLLAAATLPIWGPSGLGDFYHSDVVPFFAIPVALTVMAALCLSLLPTTLIYVIIGSQPRGFRVRLGRQKRAEFLDALSAAILRCQQADQSGTGITTPGSTDTPERMAAGDAAPSS